MKWGQNIFKTVRNKVGERRKRKKAEKQLRKEAILVKKYKAKVRRQEEKDRIQYIKGLQRTGINLGKLTDKDIKDLAARMENEAKIRKHIREYAKELPPSSKDKILSSIKTIGDIPFPQAKYDKSGNFVGYETGGTVKDYVLKSAINAGVSYMARTMNANINADKVTDSVMAAKEVVEQAKEATKKVKEQQSTKKSKKSKPETIYIRDEDITRIKRASNYQQTYSYEFYPNQQLLLNYKPD